MTEPTYHIEESAMYSCVEIIKRTTTRSSGIGALIPPSCTSRDETILSIPYRSTLLPSPNVAMRDKAAALHLASTILPLITNP